MRWGGGCQYVATRLPSDVRSATFGPSRTALSQPIVGWIHKYIEIKTTASAPDSDYLFPSAADPSKPLSPSAWTRLVKAVWKRHSGVPLCPKASHCDFKLRFILWILSCLAARGGRTGTYTRTRTSMMHERRDRATWHLRERGEVVHTRTVWVCANPGFAQTYCCTPLHPIISCLRKRSLGDVRFLPVASGPTALSEHPPPSPTATRASTLSA